MKVKKKPVKRVLGNPLKMDPSRTATIRRAMTTGFNQRFEQLKKAITKLVVEEDCFGLKPETHDPFAVTNSNPNHDKEGKFASSGSTHKKETNLQLEQRLYKEHLASQKAKQAEHPIVTKMKAIEPLASGGHLVGMQSIRSAMSHLSKEEVDKQVLDLSKKGVVSLHTHDFPSGETQHARDQMLKVKVQHGDAYRVYQGHRYYVGVAIKQQPVGNTKFKFHSTVDQIGAFKQWMMQQVSILLLADGEKSWWRKYIVDGFKKGQGRVFDDFKHADKSSPHYQFLKNAFNNPISEERIDVLASRVFTELKGVTEAMAQGIQRELTDGLTQGLNPKAIAKNINDKVEGIGKNRARMIAQTEVIRAHAEGQLDELESMGVGEVGVQVEFSAAHQGACPICQKLNGKRYTIEKARGVIPVHVCCRCCFRPVVETDTDPEKPLNPKKGETPKKLTEPGKTQPEKPKIDLEKPPKSASVWQKLRKFFTGSEPDDEE